MREHAGAKGHRGRAAAGTGGRAPAGGGLYSRREALAVLAPLLAVPLLGASGCRFSSLLSGAKDGVGFPGDYAVAVVKSNVSNISTYIEYYDASLELAAKLEYPYSTLENSWGRPERSGSEVFLCNQGVEGLRTSTTVVGIDTTTGRVREYDTGIRALQGCTATERYVYATRNLNLSAPIARVDRQTGERVQAEYPGLLYPFAYGGRVYAFNTDVPGRGRRAALLTLGEDLGLLDSIDFGSGSRVPQATGFMGDNLYFVMTKNADEVEWKDKVWSLCRFLPADSDVSEIMKVTGMRLGLVASKGDALFVLGSANVLGGPRNKVLVVDSRSGEAVAEQPLTFEPEHLLVSDNALYVAGYDDDVNGTGRQAMALAAFDIAEGGLTETGKVFLANSEKDRPGRYYLTGLFAKR
jgi:DNA-binding beta-propeller fold protein YncE